jgi:MFS family permease
VNGKDVESCTDALLREGREELNRADTKTAALFGIFGIAASALLAAAIAGQWSPNSLHHQGARWALWVSLVLAGTGLVLLVLGFRPRTRTIGSADRTVSYFGDVVTFSKKEDFINALHDVRSKRVDRATDQVWQISHVARTKYRHINLALMMFGMAAAIAVVALIIEVRG